MFTRRPGTFRTKDGDTDGEDDPPIVPAPTQVPLQNENLDNITDEDGNPIFI